MTHVTIPLPQPIPDGKGVHAARHINPFTFRLSIADEEVIIKASEVLGVTKSNFVRWCATQVAMKIIERTGGNDASHVIGESDPSV